MGCPRCGSACTGQRFGFFGANVCRKCGFSWSDSESLDEITYNIQEMREEEEIREWKEEKKRRKDEELEEFKKWKAEQDQLNL